MYRWDLSYHLQDLLPEVSVVTVEEASDTLRLALNLCNATAVNEPVSPLKL